MLKNVHSRNECSPLRFFFLELDDIHEIKFPLANGRG